MDHHLVPIRHHITLAIADIRMLHPEVQAIEATVRDHILAERLLTFRLKWRQTLQQ